MVYKVNHSGNDVKSWGDAGKIYPRLLSGWIFLLAEEGWPQ